VDLFKYFLVPFSTCEVQCTTSVQTSGVRTCMTGTFTGDTRNVWNVPVHRFWSSLDTFLKAKIPMCVRLKLIHVISIVSNWTIALCGHLFLHTHAWVNNSYSTCWLNLPGVPSRGPTHSLICHSLLWCFSELFEDRLQNVGWHRLYEMLLPNQSKC